jgi:hypothetical protein
LQLTDATELSTANSQEECAEIADRCQIKMKRYPTPIGLKQLGSAAGLIKAARLSVFLFARF